MKKKHTQRDVFAGGPTGNFPGEGLDDNLVGLAGLEVLEFPATLVLAISRHRGEASITRQ